jgi:hypothetical protein
VAPRVVNALQPICESAAYRFAVLFYCGDSFVVFSGSEYPLSDMMGI